MGAKSILIVISLLFTLVLAGCAEKETMRAAEPSTAATEPAATPQETEQPYTQSLTPEEELRRLEITPSGDPKCFLSPCDCNCYPVKNVPLNVKKPTCAEDCSATYGISGCRFTNYQCVTLT